MISIEVGNGTSESTTKLEADLTMSSNNNGNYSNKDMMHMLLMRQRSKISLLTSMFVFGITIITTLTQSLVLYNFDIDFAINAYAQQKYSSSLDIPGKVVNSKYLHITDQKYIQGKLGYDTITGTIVNNVAKNISFATVYAALYDKNNTLITIESGFVSVSLLNPGGKSPFAIDVFGIKDVDHYTLFPAGIP